MLRETGNGTYQFILSFLNSSGRFLHFFEQSVDDSLVRSSISLNDAANAIGRAREVQNFDHLVQMLLLISRQDGLVKDTGAAMEVLETVKLDDKERLFRSTGAQGMESKKSFVHASKIEPITLDDGRAELSNEI